MSDEIFELNNYIGDLHIKIQQLMSQNDYYRIRSEAERKLAKFGADVFQLLENGEPQNNFMPTLSVEKLSMQLYHYVRNKNGEDIYCLKPGIKEAVEELIK